MAAKPLNPDKKSRHGGQRKGAGRKPKGFHQLRKEIISAFEQGIVEFLPKALENLVVLANGGYERVEEKWSDDEGLGVLSLTERKVSVAEPDRAANQYIIDRVMGKPRQSVHITDDSEDQTMNEAVESVERKFMGQGGGRGPAH